MEVEHIISNNSCFKQSFFSWLESNIQYHTTLISWFKFPSESINCTKVTSSLVLFRISKSLFFFHIVRLYCRFYSTFIFILFFIIVLAKWIILLNIFVYRVNDSSIRFTISVTALLSPINWKPTRNEVLQKPYQNFFVLKYQWKCCDWK